MKNILNNPWFIGWAFYTVAVIFYWVGRYHEWKINEREKEETTFEFENKEIKP